MLLTSFNLIPIFGININTTYDYNFVNTIADFNNYNFEDNPKVRGIYSNSYQINIGSEFIINDRVFLIASIHYSDLEFGANSFLDELINVDGDLFNGRLELKNELGLDLIGTSIGIRYHLIDRLSLLGALSISSPFNTYYNRAERIIFPSDRGVFFESGSRKRNESDGEISSLSSIVFFGNIGFEYKLPLNTDNNTFLLVKANMNRQFNSFSTEEQLITYSIGGAIGISFYLKGRELPIKIKKKQDYDPLKKPEVSISPLLPKRDAKIIVNNEEKSIYPDKITFTNIIISNADIKQWRFVATINEEVILSIQESGNPPPIIDIFFDDIAKEKLFQLSKEKGNCRLTFNLFVIDEYNRTGSGKEGYIEVIKK